MRVSIKRITLSLWICFSAYCGTPSNTAPLAFGMTPEEVQLALGVPLVLYATRGTSELYLAYGSAGVPGFYPVGAALALQFRRGRLTGWKKDWQLSRTWPF
jgi:hypothetical protein